VFVFIIAIFLTMDYGLWTIDCFAADKVWVGGGDGESWSDEDNWFPQVSPTRDESVLINSEDVTVECSQTFEAQSVTVGGAYSSTLTSENFVYGEITPRSVDDVAVLNSKDGKIILKGAAGVFTLSGQYKASKEISASEVNFMFWVE